MREVKAAATSVKLVIPSEIKLVDLVHSVAERMAEVAGFDADEGLNVGLAVREAVINAMVHGNRMDPQLEVRLTFEASSGGLTATVRDCGEGFDPDTMPDPTSDPNLLRTSGRGVLLMRAFVDNVTFRKLGGRGMEVELTKRLRAGGGGGSGSGPRT
jgi:serine/threonine-protein kinase RsbW